MSTTPPIHIYTFVHKHDSKHIDLDTPFKSMLTSMDNYKRNYAKMVSHDILGEQHERVVGGDGFHVEPT